MPIYVNPVFFKANSHFLKNPETIAKLPTTWEDHDLETIDPIMKFMLASLRLRSSLKDIQNAPKSVAEERATLVSRLKVLKQKIMDKENASLIPEYSSTS